MFKYLLPLSFRTNSNLLLASLLFRFKYRKRILVIGDSHASFLLHGYPHTNGSRENFWAFWLGPKLLFSISRDGVNIERNMERTLRVIAPTYICFLFGEIDVRTRLSHFTDQPEVTQRIVNLYLAQCRFFSDSHGLKFKVVLEAPPPTRHLNLSKDFPTRGSIGDRSKAHALLTQELRIQSRKEGFEFVPFPATLLDSEGHLADQYTSDGCHTSLIANEIWRSQILKLICN